MTAILNRPVISIHVLGFAVLVFWGLACSLLPFTAHGAEPRLVYATGFEANRSTTNWFHGSETWSLENGHYCGAGTDSAVSTDAWRYLNSLPEGGYQVTAQINIQGELESLGDAPMEGNLGIFADDHYLLVSFVTYDVDDPKYVESACLYLDNGYPLGCIDSGHWASGPHTLKLVVKASGSGTEIAGYIDGLEISTALVDIPVPVADPSLWLGSWGAHSVCIDSVSVRAL